MPKQILDLCSKSRTEWEELIYQHIFNERDRRLITRRLLDGICYEPLAEEFSLSVRQTKRIIADCLYELILHV